MKKLFISLGIVFLTTTVGIAATPDSSRIKGTKSATEMAESISLQNRLKEIESMDKSALSRVERKAIRKEVRSIDKRLQQIGGGVYISVGTLLLIIILLLIFL